jgi:hypothetical protein
VEYSEEEDEPAEIPSLPPLPRRYESKSWRHYHGGMSLSRDVTTTEVWV